MKCTFHLQWEDQTAIKTETTIIIHVLQAPLLLFGCYAVLLASLTTIKIIYENGPFSWPQTI